MENNLFRTWLNSITQIIKKQQEIAAIRGENYNLFKVIHMTSNETSVHSAFIADLLNPKGLHGMGDEFLRLFVETIDTHGLDLDIQGSKVEIEKVIGPRTETTGGRLDIIVYNKEQAIIIENKIYAEDQEAQMLRYHNYAQKQYRGKHLLLYLSLDGLVHDNDFTTKGQVAENKDFFTISYKEDILNWLYECRQLAVDRPLLREGLSHYINLVKYLTHTNMSAQAKKEMTDIILKDPTYIKNLNAYAEVIEASKKELTVVFWKELFSKMYDKYREQLRIVHIDDKTKALYPPTEERILNLAQKFKLKREGNKNGYSFGCAISIASNSSQQLVVSIMVEGAVSFRVFAVDKNDIILYKDERNSFHFLREKLIENGENILADKWKSKNLYICAKRPNNELAPWHFSEMDNKALLNLSNMESCTTTILKEFEAYIEYLKEALNEAK